MKTHVEFENGEKMPIIGLGMWQTTATDEGELETSLNEALKIGYRHFDTAFSYGNEELLGKVLKEWFESGKIKREELFIVTKLPLNAMRRERVEEFLKKSLADLQLEYVDLYLIHGPVGSQYVSDRDYYPIKDGKLWIDITTDLEEVWKAMEFQVDAGRAKSIGISNFNVKQIERIVKCARIRPQNTQVELNVQFQQKELREVCKKHKITVCAYGPLGSPGRQGYFEKRGMTIEIPRILEDPTVIKMAKKYAKSTGQILLKFLTQQNIVVIPKSVNPARLNENFEIFDFELDAEDMALLEELDQGEAGRSFKMSTFPGVSDHPECPYA